MMSFEPAPETEPHVAETNGSNAFCGQSSSARANEVASVALRSLGAHDATGSSAAPLQSLSIMSPGKSYAFGLTVGSLSLQSSLFLKPSPSQSSAETHM